MTTISKMFSFIISLSLTLFLLSRGVYGYIKSSRIVSISSRLNTQQISINNPTQSQYDVLTNDAPRNLDSKWLQIFDGTNPTNTPIVPEKIVTISLPNVQAWRSSLTSNVLALPVQNDNSPPTLHEYLNGIKELSSHHEQFFGQLWDKMKNSMKGVLKIKEAFRIAYISLHGKQTIRSLEVSIDRAR